jgi:hypothetical protein
MTFGVVIPAYRGAAVLSRSVGSLAEQVSPPGMHVIIAVNDGVPATADVAGLGADPLRSKGIPCDVIHAARGRARALNAAESSLPPGPRMYLDQDAVLSEHVVNRLSAMLAPKTGVHFAAPALRRVTTREAWSTRHYFDAWQDLPYVARSPVTAGVYAVSEEGRRRWGAFPTLHSDDKYVRLQFSPWERRTAAGCTYDVLLPNGFADLVRARRRYRRGNHELVEAMREAPLPPDLPRYSGVLRSWLGCPGRWPSIAVMLAVHALAIAPAVSRASGR